MNKEVNQSGITLIIIGVLLIFTTNNEFIFMGIGFFVASSLLVLFNNIGDK